MSLIFCTQNKQINFQGNCCSPQAEAALGSRSKQVLRVLKTAYFGGLSLFLGIIPDVDVTGGSSTRV